MAIGVASFAQNNRMTVRGVTNPLDKSTVVSIMPKEIDEHKPTIQPGRFRMAPGSYEKPTILVVGTSSWWRDVDESQPLLEIGVGSIQVADSIVRDYCSGILGCDMTNRMPGLFFLPGEFTLEKLIKDHKPMLDAALAKQRAWYMELVRMADTLWARSNGNPMAIGDDMRLAAQELQLKDKVWNADFSTIQLVNCPACGNLIKENFPICPNCKVVIDAKKVAELGLKFAS